MNRNYRPGSRRDRRQQRIRIEIVRCGNWLYWNRCRTALTHGEPGGNERVRRYQYFVARADAVRLQQQMQRIQSVPDTDAEFHAAIVRKLGLERFHLGTHDEPARIQHTPKRGFERHPDLLMHSIQIKEWYLHRVSPAAS